MIQTYRYMRVGVIVLFVGLAFSVLYEICRTHLCVQASISAYYYTPSRAIFVGTLITAGFAMIAVQGRTPRQDLWLNISGMTAPGIALVPAAFPATNHNRCGSVDLMFKSQGVANNGLTYLVMLFVGGVAAAVLTHRRDPRLNPLRRVSTEHRTVPGIRDINLVRGFAATGAVGLVGAIWFFADRKAFERHGHLASGGVMFVSVSVVAILAASASNKAPDRRNSVFHWATVCVILSGALVGGILLLAHSETWLFWLEVLMLIGFVMFWTLQTVETWNGEPHKPSTVQPREDIAERPAPARAPRWRPARWLVDRTDWPADT